MKNKYHILSLLLVLAAPLLAADKSPTWTDPEKATKEDPDFSIQGEYGKNAPGADLGVQVVALGKGKFDAYLLEGGLPGVGWTKEKKRTRISGETDGAVVKFPESNGYSAEIRDGKITLTSGGKKTTLPRIHRQSPTLNAKPPAGAVVLFDGSSADEWKNGKVVDGLLAATNAMSKKAFSDCIIHIEFRTPYKPQARGQKRGNSGVYHGGRWETQILDSFGLDGKMNECGGIYSVAAPRLNMCLPPLTWQTYDVELIAAKFDEKGNRTAWPRITVKLNGVLVHENLELAKNATAAAPLKGPIPATGNPIFLQNHANPVFFRNIWVKEK
ncbi:MAG: DUF1080 domain-containing protein [Akkermansiaceae bacterium]